MRTWEEGHDRACRHHPAGGDEICGGRDRSRRCTVLAAPCRRGGADQDRHAAGVDRSARLGWAAIETRRRAVGQDPERQGRGDRPADSAVDRGYRRQPGRRGAQSPGNGGARRLQYLHRHHLVLRGAGGGAEARGVEGDLRFLRQRRREADRGNPSCPIFSVPTSRRRWARGRCRSSCGSRSGRTFYAIGMDYAWGRNSVRCSSPR